MLKENTDGNYELLYISGIIPKDVYPTWNQLAEAAKYDLLLWGNTDLLPAKGWDRLVRKYIKQADWLCCRVVECGQIGVAPTMIKRDFGITAKSFRRQKFEQFVEEEGKKYPEFERGFIWYCPSIFRKDWFLKMDGFSTDKPFPNPNDILFKEKVEKKGCRFGIVNSWFYHLQRAGENLGQKKERI